MFVMNENSRPLWILIAMSTLCLLINIDYTAVNLALVGISQDIDPDLKNVQWVLSAYILSWGACIVPSGKFSDLYGKRRVLLVGVVIFVLSSLMIGFSTNMTMLILGRVLQGAGAALFVPPIYSITYTTFEESKRGFVIGVIGAISAIGMAIGPTMGGFILEHFGWRWIFFINIPLGIVVFLVTIWAVTKDRIEDLGVKLNKPGMIFFSSFLVLVMLMIHQGDNPAKDYEKFVGVSFLCISSFGLFLYQQFKSDNPLIPNALFKNRSFLGCSIAIFVFEFIFSAFLVIMALYLQNILSYEADQAGFIFLAMTITIGIFSPFGGKLVDRMDGRIPLVIGMVFLAFGTFLSLAFSVDTSLLYVIVCFIFVGLGFGLSISPVNAILMHVVPEKDLNVASAFFAMSALVGASIGVIMSTSLLVNKALIQVTSLIKEEALNLTEAQYQSLIDVMNDTHYSIQKLVGYSPELLYKAMGVIRLSFLHGMASVMYLGLALSVASVFICWFMIKLQKRVN